MAEWYYALGGQQKGPVSLDVLKQLTASGKLSRTDMVWHEGLADWKKASQVDELYPRTEIVESPKRRPAAAAVEAADDDDRPRDYDDRPRKKKKRKQESSPGMMAAIIGSSVGGGLLILIIIIVLLVRAGQNRHVPPVAAMPPPVVVEGNANGAPAAAGNGAAGQPGAVQPTTYTVTLREGQDHTRAITFQQGQRVEVIVRTPQGLLRNPDVDLFINRLNDVDFDLVDDAISKDCYLQFVAPATDQYVIRVENLGPGSATSTVTIR